ncbi:phytanoyl-CoA dioxygenase family protein [Novosphingobium sp.]|uniref:phytanoyl-CoA dioxygenase family protein n=1 Tax=Novosphingobium sp. TaxID=1874826 RepID=UPI00333E27A4
MTATLAPLIDPATCDAFRDDGVVVLRGLFGDWIEPLREGARANMAQPSPLHRNYTKAGARFFGDYCNWAAIPEFRAFVEGSPAGAVARELMGSRIARIFHEHLLVKEPGADIPTPWHHDSPYYCVDGRQTVSLWLPLDPVPREICLESVAGSHAWGKLFRPRRFDGTAYDHDSAGLVEMPDISATRDQYRIVSWDLQPGDCIAFNFLTVHGAPGNPTGGARRAFSTRWFGEDARYADRGGATSPPYPDLATRLRAGDPLPEDLFPVIARA